MMHKEVKNAIEKKAEDVVKDNIVEMAKDKLLPAQNDDIARISESIAAPGYVISVRDNNDGASVLVELINNIINQEQLEQSKINIEKKFFKRWFRSNYTEYTFTCRPFPEIDLTPRARQLTSLYLNILRKILKADGLLSKALRIKDADDSSNDSRFVIFEHVPYQLLQGAFSNRVAEQGNGEAILNSLKKFMKESKIQKGLHRSLFLFDPARLLEFIDKYHDNLVNDIFHPYVQEVRKVHLHKNLFKELGDLYTKVYCTLLKHLILIGIDLFGLCGDTFGSLQQLIKYCKVNDRVSLESVANVYKKLISKDNVICKENKGLKNLSSDSLFALQELLNSIDITKHLLDDVINQFEQLNTTAGAIWAMGDYFKKEELLEIIKDPLNKAAKTIKELELHFKT